MKTPVSPVRSFRLPVEDPRNILRRIVSESHLSLDSASELLDMSKRRILSSLDGRSASSLRFAYVLCEKLNISLDKVVSNEVDWVFLRHCLLYGNRNVPSKYLEFARSRVRTIQNILSFMERHLGADSSQIILRRLQLHSDMFLDGDAKVNMRLGIDLVEEMSTFLNQPRLGYAIGLHSSSLGMASLIGELKGATSWDAYDYFFSEGRGTARVESNRIWTLTDVSKKVITIASVTDRSLEEAFEDHYLYSPLAEDIRLGYLSAIPSYFGLPQTKSVIYARVEKNNPVGIYRIAV